MGNNRIRYGLAYGPEGSAGATSAGHIFTPGDTTPDVSNGVFFLSVNTSATAISYFDLVGKGGIDAVSQNNGKVIKILFIDALTTINNAGNVILADTTGAIPANTVMDLVHYNSSWYEISRSRNNQTQSGLRRLNLNVAASNAINVTSANIVALTVTGASHILTGFAGGVSNQSITILYSGNSSQLTGFTQSAGNLVLAGTNAVNFLGGSAAFIFTTLNGSEWISDAGLVSP